MIRQALIPAAGRGARLDRPDTPKPLVDIGGRPLIVRLLRQLERAGVERAVVVTGYAAPQIARALTHHPDLGLAVELVENTDWAAGLAGSIRRARDHFAAPFLLAMADHVFDEAHVLAMAAAPVEPEGVACLVDPDAGRVFDLAEAVKVVRRGDRVLDLGRGLDPAGGVDAGLFLATPALFDALALAGGDDLTHGVRHLARDGRARAVLMTAGGWDDVDTPAALVHAELRLRNGRRAARVHRPARAVADGVRYTFETGARRSTEVLIARGAVADPGSVPLIPEESASSPVFVFTDETVNGLYGDGFVEVLRGQGYDVHRIVLPDGEAAKTLACYAHVVERVLGKGIDERSVLVSLGGGVVCNVCGFVASTLYRGVGLVHVPTTLMAQCDAAISHKQAVNGARGKNLVGTYHAPQRIVVDVDALATLDDRLLRDGLAEALKHALAQDADHARALLDGPPPDLRDPAFLERVVGRNIELKCRLMAVDPQEHREGMVLQYGHEVGHAVEHLTGYTLYHGESVAVGMMVAARVAHLLGACDADLVDLHRRLLARFGLPTFVPGNIRGADVLAAMRYNKRYLVEGNRMALLSGLGQLWSVGGEHAIPVSDAVLLRALEESRG